MPDLGASLGEDRYVGPRLAPGLEAVPVRLGALVVLEGDVDGVDVGLVILRVLVLLLVLLHVVLCGTSPGPLGRLGGGGCRGGGLLLEIGKKGLNSTQRTGLGGRGRTGLGGEDLAKGRQDIGLLVGDGLLGPRSAGGGAGGRLPGLVQTVDVVSVSKHAAHTGGVHLVMPLELVVGLPGLAGVRVGSRVVDVELELGVVGLEEGCGGLGGMNLDLGLLLEEGQKLLLLLGLEGLEASVEVGGDGGKGGDRHGGAGVGLVEGGRSVLGRGVEEGRSGEGGRMNLCVSNARIAALYKHFSVKFCDTEYSSVAQFSACVGLL